MGGAFNKSNTYNELKLIASDPDEDHAFKVTNYMALDGLLSKLQQRIIRVEGECPWGSPLGVQQEARGLSSSPAPVLPPRGPAGQLLSPL